MTIAKAYWLTRLDNIGIGLGIFTCIFLVLGIICAFAWGEDWEYKVRFTWIVSVGLSLTMLLAILIPSTKEMAFIILAPKIALYDVERPNVEVQYGIDAMRKSILSAAGKDLLAVLDEIRNILEASLMPCQKLECHNTLCNCQLKAIEASLAKIRAVRREE